VAIPQPKKRLNSEDGQKVVKVRARNTPSKNHQKAPKTITMLVKDGRYRDVYIPDNIWGVLFSL